MTTRVCLEGTNWLLLGCAGGLSLGRNPVLSCTNRLCAFVNTSEHTSADGFVTVHNLTELYWLARDPRHITGHDEMSNAHCPLPPIVYTSQLKGAIEEGFVKRAIESEQVCRTGNAAMLCAAQLFISHFCIYKRLIHEAPAAQGKQLFGDSSILLFFFFLGVFQALSLLCFYSCVAWGEGAHRIMKSFLCPS